LGVGSVWSDVCFFGLVSIACKTNIIPLLQDGGAVHRLYAWATYNPGAMNTSAVGYSGVLFAYALVEAFHSPDTSRSVFGMFNVPTKAYPFILLVLIQVKRHSKPSVAVRYLTLSPICRCR
jgi:hypothetical protein